MFSAALRFRDVELGYRAELSKQAQDDQCALLLLLPEACDECCGMPVCMSLGAELSGPRLRWRPRPLDRLPDIFGVCPEGSKGVPVPIVEL